MVSVSCSFIMFTNLILMVYNEFFFYLWVVLWYYLVIVCFISETNWYYFVYSIQTSSFKISSFVSVWLTVILFVFDSFILIGVSCIMLHLEWISIVYVVLLLFSECLSIFVILDSFYLNLTVNLSSSCNGIVLVVLVELTKSLPLWVQYILTTYDFLIGVVQPLIFSLVISGYIGV